LFELQLPPFVIASADGHVPTSLQAKEASARPRKPAATNLAANARIEITDPMVLLRVTG
jgi:hypothetical protein